MILEYVYDRTLAQASYVVGCPGSGTAAVIDPARDITPYLEIAERHGLQITHAFETHIHADYISGANELAANTGATIIRAQDIDHGDFWSIGSVDLQAFFSPGHTPEHMSYLLTDKAVGDQPMGMFTGDFIFVGDVGRPDLLEEALGDVGSADVGARQMFESLKKAAQLPDFLQIWPGHGAGSACGKSLGAVPSTTLGYEKAFNPAFQFTDEDEFVAWLLADQPEAPRYFAQMKTVNAAGPTVGRDGPAVLNTLPEAQQGTLETLEAALEAGLQVVDFRRREVFEAANLPGTLNVPITSTTYTTYLGYFVDYASPMHLIMPTDGFDAAIIKDLRAIGIDNIAEWYPASLVEQATMAEALPVVSAQDALAHMDDPQWQIVDVRNATEWDEGHLDGAQHIALGRLAAKLDELPEGKTLALHCQSGLRSQIATSYLRARGYDNVVNIAGGYEALSAARNETVNA